MFLRILLSYPGQSLSLDHVNNGYIRDVMFRVIYKLKQARLQASLSSHRRVQRSFPSLAGHFGRSSGNTTLTGRNGTIDLFKNGYFTAIQVKYVEMLMDFVCFGVNFGMIRVAHDHVR